VTLDAALPSSLPTTISIAAIDQHGSAHYGFYTQGTAAPALTTQAALRALLAAFDILHVGSLEPIASAVTGVVETDAARSALVMVDPNIRSSLILDRSQYLARLGRVLRRTHVLKASVEDLAWLAPHRTATAAARELLDRGPKVVLVTRGEQGAVVVGPERAVSIAARPVHVVDTIGAGDAFNAGFLAWWKATAYPATTSPTPMPSRTPASSPVTHASAPGATPPRFTTFPDRSELPRREPIALNTRP
jgi:fructokinase